MSGPLAIIAAGGTGGHMFPAQALAEALLARGWRVRLSTDDRGARYAGGFPGVVVREVVDSATFARGGGLAKLAVPFRVLRGVLAARARMTEDRPAVVVGFGGYPSIPAIGAAWMLGLPRMIHEQNGVLGRVNRIFARRVDRVACGTWPTALPLGVTAEHTGNPVRAAVRERAAATYLTPGNHPMQIVVIGGSQGARILSEVVPSAILGLPPEIRRNLRIAQQAREEDAARVTRAYDMAGLRADVQTFFADIPARIAAAELVISRAGASSVADISVIGRPSILIPFAAATGDHQTANALGLAQAGATVVIPEADLTPARLTAEITGILTDPARAAGMAAAALAVSRPDATERLVALVEGLALGTKGQNP